MASSPYAVRRKLARVQRALFVKRMRLLRGAMCGDVLLFVNGRLEKVMPVRLW